MNPNAAIVIALIVGILVGAIVIYTIQRGRPQKFAARIRSRIKVRRRGNWRPRKSRSELGESPEKSSKTSHPSPRPERSSRLSGALAANPGRDLWTIQLAH
jgi:hypothetical protein